MVQSTTAQPAAFDQFVDYIAAVLGTRRWVVKGRLTDRLRGEGYTVAVNGDRYRQLRQAWEDAHGWAMGFPPEMQPAWLRDAIGSYMAEVVIAAN